MKAIVVHEPGGPEVLRLEEVPEPRPAAGQALVRILAAGVNPVDTYVRAGTSYKTQTPYTPGMDGAGVIEAVGDAVGDAIYEGAVRFRPGDRVYLAGSISGTYAEKALCKESQIHPLPANVSFMQGAAVNVPYATAYRALFQRARAAAGESVLIHGASGGVGIAAVQLARAAGLNVIATAGSERGRELIRQEGAHHVLDHQNPSYLEAIPELTGGRGVDAVLEMLANVNLDKDLGIIAQGGRIVVIGSRGRIEIDPRKILAREAAVLGVLILAASEKESGAIHAALGAGLENGTLRPIIGREFRLAEAPQAHIAVLEPGAYGKIILIPHQ